MECNCSHCSRKGYLLWFVPLADFTLNSPESALSTYTFNQHVIKHHSARRAAARPSDSAPTARVPKRRPSTCDVWKAWN